MRGSQIKPLRGGGIHLSRSVLDGQDLASAWDTGETRDTYLMTEVNTLIFRKGISGRGSLLSQYPPSQVLSLPVRRVAAELQTAPSLLPGHLRQPGFGFSFSRPERTAHGPVGQIPAFNAPRPLKLPSRSSRSVFFLLEATLLRPIPHVGENIHPPLRSVSTTSLGAGPLVLERPPGDRAALCGWVQLSLL